MENKDAQRNNEVAKIVRTFYDTYGWIIEETSGLLYHYTYFQDLDERAIRYRYSHELRYQKYFREGGAYFLDAGCGGEPRIKMSPGFGKHVCVDLSIVGLKEARNQLGDAGEYVLADLTALPFKDEVFAGVLASHCLYHVEKDAQTEVLRELYRSAEVNKNILVFYSSRNNPISLLHQVPGMIFPFLNRFLKRAGFYFTNLPPYLRRAFNGEIPREEDVPPLYSYSHNPIKLARMFNTVDVTCLMSLSMYDTQLLRKFHIFGVVVPVINLLERAFPHAMRYIGKFTCLRISKDAEI